MASALDRALDQQRRRLARREAVAVAEIEATYRVVMRAFRADLALAEAEIADRRASGDPLGPSLLFQDARLQSLVDQAERAVRAITTVAEGVVRVHGLAAIGEAAGDLRDLILAAIGPGPQGAALSFATLPVDSIQQLSLALSSGSPVVAVLDGMAGEARQRVQDELTAGLATGRSPREIGQRIAQIVGGQRARAELIATEAIFNASARARTATAVTNKHLLRGMRRDEAIDSRTCILCIAEHGREYAVGADFPRHARCRGSLVPIIRKDLGFDQSTPTQAGPERFAAFPEARQRSVLGEAAYLAYAAGDVEPRDFVQRTNHPVWGPGLRRRSLDEALGAAERRTRRAA